MRIIAGKLKGRVLKIPRGIRPTSQKVREALFSILGNRIIDGVVLDLFAGSGALGIEALSRGAKSATFVDNNRKCVQTIKVNLELCGLSSFQSSSLRRKERDEKIEIRVLSMEALKAIRFFERKGERFDLIFLDPPYYYEAVAKNVLINVVIAD